MSLITKINQFQIISDGENVVLLLDSETQQGALVLKDAYMTSCNVQVINDFFEFSSGFDGVVKRYPYSSQTVCDFSLLSSDIKFTDISNPILELDFFRNMTVRELFREINKKLNRR